MSEVPVTWPELATVAAVENRTLRSVRDAERSGAKKR
jgi:hypothetical protein